MMPEEESSGFVWGFKKFPGKRIELWGVKDSLWLLKVENAEKGMVSS